VVVASRMHADAIVDAVNVARATYVKGATDLGRVPDYEGGRVSAKVARIVSGYIDFVNRSVWSKPTP
jgi:UDP-N-acetylglucosamine 2-epimerase (non-hydrolysing)